MPALEGQFIPVLRVRDLDLSAQRYARALRLSVSSRYQTAPGNGQVVLGDPASGLTLCLVADGVSDGPPFDEHALGLDHLEFLVPDVNELRRWVEHLDALGIRHSGLKEPEHSLSAMVTFRDPDDIQLELFCAGR